MNRFSIVFGFAVVLLWGAIASAETPPDEQSKEIPLAEIWTYRMPGTKSVRDLEPKVELKELSVDEMVRVSIVHRIYNSLTRGKVAAPSFVVEGTAAVALKNAEAVFLGADPPEKLKANIDLTLVFYSLLCGRDVRIDSIERTKDRITIKYYFIARVSQDMWAEFALIPLGKLAPGTVEVEVVELPTVNANPNLYKAGPISELDQRVSGPSSFQVTE